MAETPGGKTSGLQIGSAPPAGSERPAYGEGDATYQAAGQLEGIRLLVDAFYRIMDELPQAQTIRRMHPSDLEVSRDKLTRFLSGWTNGPRLYAEKYGPMRIPPAHAHLRVGPAERDAWLICMELALKERDYPPDFVAYLLRELSVPAERIVQVSKDPLP
ncbi:MAG: group II truncated hemoglobin [Myxococcota bacterium]